MKSPLNSINLRTFIPYYRLFISLMVVLALFTLSRLLMWLFNPQLFGHINFAQYLPILFNGLRFDISSMLFLNGSFIFISLVLVYFPASKLIRKLNFIIFYCIPNSVAFLGNLVDVIYYRYTLKRMTADIFDYLEHAGGMGALLPQFARDFWYITLIVMLFVVILVIAGNRVHRKTSPAPQGFRTIAVHACVALAILFFSVVGMRGGFQLKPIDIAQAGKYVKPSEASLLLNTAFCVLKTFGKVKLKEVRYFNSQTEMEQLFSAHQNNGFDGEPDLKLKTQHPNIIVLLLEGISTEHIGALKHHISDEFYTGYTPFLDSLAGRSFVFDGYANGKRSIEAVPAILSSVPSLMNNDFISSVYSNNQTTSLPALLKGKGYETLFFHGGNNGTMGFDTYAKSVGFDKYIGRKEYANDDDYDGNWGIFDEPFLQFTANILNQTNQPFFSFIFTLSSHHPYTIPPEYAGKLKQGPLPIHQVISYTDEALRQFFKTASLMPWFDNTLFIITTDHTSEPYYPYYKSPLGVLSIPMFFYTPGLGAKLPLGGIMQHTDILPTVLHILGYDKDFAAFGHSAFSTTHARFNITFLNNQYQLIKDGYVLQFDGNQAVALYEWQADPFCKTSILGSNPQKAEELTLFTKAIIQQYNYRMIHNKLAE